jgi:uncharacterized protein (TIGR02271 family)
MGFEKILTVYDTEQHARDAVRVLESSGFASSDISVLNKASLPGNGSAITQLRDAGLWRRLFGTEVRAHEAEVYGHAIENGGAILSLRVPDNQVAKAMAILDVKKPVDVVERATAIGATVPASVVAAATTATLTSSTAPALPGKEEILKLAEEQLNVSKRQVEAGTTRIRRFVTEKPVEAQITLHEEHAAVVRRAVKDPAFIQDVDWSDRVIEVKETAEQAVVNKTVRLAEEVVISKEGTDRVETVRDTVRRQQVDVERMATKAKTA